MKISHNYLASSEEQRLLNEVFVLQPIQLDFSILKPTYTEIISGGSGVYFIAGHNEESILKVYVGKADNLRRRIIDYHRAFQVHCPNDRKIAFFQEWLHTTDPKWNLVLYTLSADKKHINEIEKKWIREFDPLVNATIRSNKPEFDAGKNMIRDAYKKYFTLFFKNRINN
jgi:hypothetical protein